MIRALDDPSCREVATGLLPRVLPILISRALSTATAASAHQHPITESRSLSVDLLLAASRLASPVSLKHALPQLTLAALQSMSRLNPARVVSVLRPSVSTTQHLNWYSTGANISVLRESQMAEVLRLVRCILYGSQQPVESSFDVFICFSAFAWWMIMRLSS